jgi:hypothetical protein
MYARCPLLFLGCQLLAPVPVVIDDGVLVDGYYTDATLEVTVLSVESLRQTPSYSLLLRLLRPYVTVSSAASDCCYSMVVVPRGPATTRCSAEFLAGRADIPKVYDAT